MTETVEQEIQRKKLTAPRITPQHIKSVQKHVEYWLVPHTTTTVCALTLTNGFVVIGSSACASKENFDRELGERIAREDAEREIWRLEGYLLRQDLHTGLYLP